MMTKCVNQRFPFLEITYQLDNGSGRLNLPNKRPRLGCHPKIDCSYLRTVYISSVELNINLPTSICWTFMLSELSTVALGIQPFHYKASYNNA